MEKRTKIICTLGPAVDNDNLLVGLIKGGMDIARLNLSHGTHEEHQRRIDSLKQIREELGKPIAILLDTKGPEIRTGLLVENSPVELVEGSEFVLTNNDVLGDANMVYQSYPDLFKYVSCGTKILLDDGKINLRVSDVRKRDIVCTVMNTGILAQRKSLNVPDVSLPMLSITDQDKRDILFGIENEIDFVALSFVRDAEAVREAKAFIRQNTDMHIGVIAKIENRDAVNNIHEIIEVADGVMVARGDLGVEVPAQEVPHLQKNIIHACNCAHKPVITATQMLESMTTMPRPTRAEAADVANAIYDGSDCVMLSGETAAGNYPLEAVRTMAEIACTSEEHYVENMHIAKCAFDGQKSVSHAVGTAAVQTALDIGARCLVCPTMTGRSARLMSSLRPVIPIYAVAVDMRVVRSMQIYWGVHPLLGDVQGGMSHVIDTARDIVVEHGFLQAGDIAVFTVGDRFTSPVKRTADGRPERFAPANVMHVVQIHERDVEEALGNRTSDVLMSRSFFETDSPSN
ncbi:pyruvate kinase [Adlercreutzia sp. ZJ154]|uniref:pyruvate kinase n=1 Tax=Adlercreutzia sp. ZJ154 TaxID=2709790 RepID=UPI0013ED9DA8|nr:pyruvate kinase [Adlercreutzia sp. ZJ154]